MANEQRLVDANVFIRDLTAMKSVYDAIALDGMIKALKEAPTVDAVPREAYEQVKWERDQAMEQLAEHRIPFGGIAPDVVEVVRCKGCKHYDNSEGIQWCHLNSKFYPGGTDWHSFPEDGFCSYGERRTNGETETT